jgi:hypothetical protein
MHNAITLVDFADSFAAKVNSLDVPDIHPAGAATVWTWLCAMRAEAEVGHAADVARLACCVNEKVAQERAWHAECLQSAQRMRETFRAANE